MTFFLCIAQQRFVSLMLILALTYIYIDGQRFFFLTSGGIHTKICPRKIIRVLEGPSQPKYQIPILDVHLGDTESGLSSSLRLGVGEYVLDVYWGLVHWS